jgi:hypothetical protein
VYVLPWTVLDTSELQLKLQLEGSARFAGTRRSAAVKARRLLLVRPQAPNSVRDKAPARAMTPGLAEPQGRGPPAVLGEGGLCDPLDGWARKDAVLAGTHSLQQPAVDVTGGRCGPRNGAGPEAGSGSPVHDHGSADAAGGPVNELRRAPAGRTIWLWGLTRPRSRACAR